MTETANNAMPFRFYFAVCVFLIYFCDLGSCTLTLAPAEDSVVKSEHENYFVRCTDSDKKPVTWSKEKKGAVGEQVKQGYPHVTRMGTHTALVFRNITYDMRGEYFCGTDVDVISFKLTVIIPITFVDTPKEQTVKVNHPGIIKCRAKGDPKPTILWKFNGTDLRSSRYHPVSEGLKIANVTLDDAGVYTCHVFQLQAGGYAKEHIHLYVKHKPRRNTPVHEKVDIVYGFIGGFVNLTCEAIAHPEAKFTWSRKNKPIKSDRIMEEPHWSAYELFITDKHDFGDYHCTAQNELGILKQIITLQEGIQPPAPQQILLKTAKSDSLEIEIVGADLNSTDLPEPMLPNGYRIVYIVRNENEINDTMQEDKWINSTIVDFDQISEDNVYIIPDLQNDKEYELRASTRNVAGFSEYTDSVFYKTLATQVDSTGGISPCIITALLSLFAAYVL